MAACSLILSKAHNLPEEDSQYLGMGVVVEHWLAIEVQCLLDERISTSQRATFM